MSEANIRNATATWTGGLAFRGGAPGGPEITIDADGKDAPGPMVTMLLTLATCSGADIVSLMPKMQVELERFTVAVRGERALEHPRRWTKIHFTMTLAGAGLDETKARRAIDLSIEKYCSAINSLNPDIPVSYDLVLE
ncbi:MAG: OsmC family protein [Gemmatimonadales bacterium]